MNPYESAAVIAMNEPYKEAMELARKLDSLRKIAAKVVDMCIDAGLAFDDMDCVYELRDAISNAAHNLPPEGRSG